MLAEALNFIALPALIAAVQSALYLLILPRFGLARGWALSPMLPILALVGIYAGGGWISFFSLLGPIPGAVHLYQFAMAMVGFLPLFLMAARRPL